MLSPVNTGMGGCVRAGIPPWCVTKPTKSTQPCILPGSLNRVPALIDWAKGLSITSAGCGWQITPCDPIWHVSSHSGEECLWPANFAYFTHFTVVLCQHVEPKWSRCRSCCYKIPALDSEAWLNPSAVGQNPSQWCCRQHRSRPLQLGANHSNDPVEKYVLFDLLFFQITHVSVLFDSEWFDNT